MCICMCAFKFDNIFFPNWQSGQLRGKCCLLYGAIKLFFVGKSKILDIEVVNVDHVDSVFFVISLEITSYALSCHIVYHPTILFWKFFIMLIPKMRFNLSPILSFKIENITFITCSKMFEQMTDEFEFDV